MPQPTLWERTRLGGRVGFDKLYGWVDKLGAPVTKLSHKIGSESFWPTTLDKESEKAARILRSFCKDGFYDEEERPTIDGPKQKQKVLVKIPSSVIKNAKGLAIFTTMRSGLWISGAGGCGIIIARLPDGSWSAPSGILLHTAGLGFLVGVDIYDCVLVINTDKAMEAFSRLRCTVGGELSAVAGPVGTGFLMESELHKRQAPIFTYLKSRGFYAGVQIDGTIMLERDEENERFYNQKLSAKEILSGKVRHVPFELERLFATLKSAEGDTSVDESLLPSEPPPGDYEIEHGSSFGVPDKDDPDPYGVLQLEKEGMVIREAGTHKRASWEQFTFAPSLTSPVYDTFERKSKDRDSRSINSGRSSWISIGSTAVNGSSARDRQKPSSPMADMSTQTDDLHPPSSPGRLSTRSSTLVSRLSMNDIPEDSVAPHSPSATSFSPRLVRRVSAKSSLSHPSTPTIESPPADLELTKPVAGLHDGGAEPSTDDEVDDEDHSDLDESVVIEEAPVVQSIQQAVTPQVIQKARMVSVPKRGPPPILPPRNPNRHRGPVVIGAEGDIETDAGSATSPRPLSDEFDPYSTHSAQATPTSSPRKQVKIQEAQNGDEEAETPEETPEEQMRNPWAKIMAQHSSNNSQDSIDVPGAFHSVPTTPEVPSTPEEHAGYHQAKEDEEDFS